jgi:uncharacterized iron-regulated membrane protein
MAFFQSLIHNPRKLWLRRALFQIHLWAGVLLSLYVVVIALTGSVLVFRSELVRTQLPRSLHQYNSDRIVPIATVLQNEQAAFPGSKIDSIVTPSVHAPAYILTATDSFKHPLTLVADPVDGSLHVQPRTWLDWIYDLHVYLLLGKAYGMQVNGVGAMFLLLLTFTGLALWWPGVRTWTRGLRVSFRHNWRRINFDTHSALGFWTVFLVAWWAFSGIYFAWYRPVSAAVAIISPLQGMVTPAKRTGPVSTGSHASLQQMLAAIHDASPDGHLYSLSDPMLSGATVYALVDLRLPGDFSHRDIVCLSTVDAQVLSIWHYGDNHTVGDWILWAMHPLHFGTLWGMTVKIIWALAGVALAALSVTGLLMYWNRFLRHRI